MVLTTFAAAIFGYFEQLLSQGDSAKIVQEIERLKTLTTSTPVVGLESDIVDLFMEPAVALLENIHGALLRKERGDAMLFQTMNSDEESNTILYYFKV
jgi:hypothetical protein